MSRPAKAIQVQTKNLTNAEKEAREFVETALKGKGHKPTPPGYLSDNQKNIFKNIVSKLDESGILGSLDVYILTTCSVAIDRLEYIENMINTDPSCMANSGMMSAKDKYTKDLYRCCNELCLSPQARAKIGSIATQAQKGQDPLIKALMDDD